MKPLKVKAILGTQNVYWKVYIQEEAEEKKVLVSIPKLEWCMMLDYTLGTQAEWQDEHNKLVHSLYAKGLQMGHAEKLADYIEEWITEQK